MASPRVSRGRETEDLAVLWYRMWGFPDAARVAASCPGRDIKGMKGLAPEVKARTGFDPRAWIRQARKNAGDDMPFVIMRCPGQGPLSIGEWLVIRRMKDDTPLLQAAYGIPDYKPPEVK